MPAALSPAAPENFKPQRVIWSFAKPTAVARCRIRNSPASLVALMDILSGSPLPASWAASKTCWTMAAASSFMAQARRRRIHRKSGWQTCRRCHSLDYASRHLRRGGRQANRALHIVISRIRCDDATKAFVKRKIAEEKSKREIIRILKRYVRSLRCPANPRLLGLISMPVRESSP